MRKWAANRPPKTAALGSVIAIERECELLIVVRWIRDRHAMQLMVAMPANAAQVFPPLIAETSIVPVVDLDSRTPPVDLAQGIFGEMLAPTLHPSL